jgi:very-short-patch-repair endonuclease
MKNKNTSEVMEKEKYIDKVFVKKEIIENKYFTYTHYCRICKYPIKVETVNRSATKLEIWDEIRSHILFHLKSKVNIKDFCTNAISLVDGYVYIQKEGSEKRSGIEESILWLANNFLEKEKRDFIEEVFEKYYDLSIIYLMKPYITRPHARDSVRISIDDFCSLLYRLFVETIEEICTNDLKLYYDDYLKEENEDVCQGCGEKLKFFPFLGYSEALSSVHRKSLCSVCYNLEELKVIGKPNLMGKHERNFWNFLERNLSGEFIYTGSPPNSRGSILGYTPDFLHIRKKIAIELGDMKRENYVERQEKCKECNITLLGFENDAISKEPEDVISIIKNAIK